MTHTSATDLLLVAYRALSEEEQETAFEAIARGRLERQADGDCQTAHFLRSLIRVREHLGEAPNSITYRRAWKELREAGEEVENLTAVIEHFGSWRLAREALELSETTTVQRIDARFARRRVGRIKRYSKATLKETVDRCVADFGYVPRLAEYMFWRRRELELARARGDDAFHLPGEGPFRRRYGSWEKALLALGYTSDEVAERLERERGAPLPRAGL